MNVGYRVNTAKVIHERFDDEVVIVDLENGNYYSTQGAGATIWTLASLGMSQAGILQAISARYSGDPTEIERESAEFLGRLLEENLVQMDGEWVARGSTEDPAPGAIAPFARPALQKYADMQELLLIDPVHQVDEIGWPSMKGGNQKG